MNLSNFRSKVRIQVRYADLDTYGHVNNKVYLSYLEEARIAYIHDLGLGDKITVFDFGSVVGRIDIKYLRPIEFGDEVWAYTRCSRLGKKSYDLENIIVIRRENQELIAARAIVTMVSFDIKTKKSKPIDQVIIDRVNEFEIEKPRRD